MPKNKPRTPAEKTAQKSRTTKNQVKKYTKLIEENPTSPHLVAWKKQLNN